jgi:hypothetical protein
MSERLLGALSRRRGLAITSWCGFTGSRGHVPGVTEPGLTTISVDWNAFLLAGMAQGRSSGLRSHIGGENRCQPHGLGAE